MEPQPQTQPKGKPADVKAPQVDLDRVPLGHEKFSVLKLPTDKNLETKLPPLIFEGAEKAPYRVDLKVPQEGLRAKPPNVVIIDSFNPLEYEVPTGKPGDERIKVKSSHLALVTHVLAQEKVQIGAIYDVCSDRTSRDWNPDRMIAALDDLLQRLPKEKFDAVNLSLASHRTVEEFNKATKALGLGDKILTPENIQNESAHMWAILREDAKRHGDDCPAAKYMKIAAALQKISDSGVPICIGAGNNSAGGFNLLAALVPDMIVVGGANGTALDKVSSSTSLNDTIQPFRAFLSTDDDRSMVFEGTSLSTPRASAEVAQLKVQGLSVSKINELLRLRMTQREMKQPTEVILFDLKMFEGFTNVEKSGKIAEALETMKLIEPNMASTLEVLVEQKSLPLANAIQFLTSIGKACDKLSLPRTEVQELLKCFAQCSDEGRKIVLSVLSKIEGSNMKLSDLMSILKENR